MNVSPNEQYDVIIIGAGISGLVCGCYLAKAGMKVLVLEYHTKPGGYCSSFKRRDFLFDAAAHSFGSYREGGNFRKILEDISLDKRIMITRFDPSDIVCTPDFEISFWNDTQRTVADLARLFPAEEHNIRKYFDYYSPQSSVNQFANMKMIGKTFSSFLGSYFYDSRLLNALTFPVFGNGGLPPSMLSAFTGTKIFYEFMIDGGYYPEGGIQQLPDALSSYIQEHGGKVFYRKCVQKILCKNETVTGVEVETGETYLSKYVVSACDITQTAKTFLKKEKAGNVLRQKVATMKSALSTFILYIGIKKPFSGLPQKGTNIWYLPHYDLDKIFYHVNRCDFRKSGGFMFRVAPDKKTILAFSLAPFRTETFWRKNKERIANILLEHVTKTIPELTQNIAYFDAATPHTLYRYTLNHKGSNYGWAPLPSQLFDPVFRHKTEIKRLYLTGHWITQTHGIPGVAYLGYNTAKSIMRREKLPR